MHIIYPYRCGSEFSVLYAYANKSTGRGGSVMLTILIILLVSSLISNIFLVIKCAVLNYLYKYLQKVLQNTKTSILNVKNCLKEGIPIPELSKTLEDYFDVILRQVNGFLE